MQAVGGTVNSLGRLVAAEEAPPTKHGRPCLGHPATPPAVVALLLLLRLAGALPHVAAQAPDTPPVLSLEVSPLTLSHEEFLTVRASVVGAPQAVVVGAATTYSVDGGGSLIEMMQLLPGGAQSSLGPFPAGASVILNVEVTVRVPSGSNTTNLTVLRSEPLEILVADVLAPRWHYDTAEAFAVSNATGRPVLIVYCADDPPACRDFDDRVMTDEFVLNRSARFVLLRLAPGDDPALVARYGLEHQPTTVYVAAGGKQLHRIVGIRTVSEFRADMRYALREGPRPPESQPRAGPDLSASALALAFLIAISASLLAVYLRFAARRG